MLLKEKIDKVENEIKEIANEVIQRYNFDFDDVHGLGYQHYGKYINFAITLATNLHARLQICLKNYSAQIQFWQYRASKINAEDLPQTTEQLNTLNELTPILIEHLRENDNKLCELVSTRQELERDCIMLMKERVKTYENNDEKRREEIERELGWA